MTSNLLTNSRMTSAKTCLAKHYMEYELGVRLDTDAKPLRMGRAVHEGLDLLAKGQTIVEVAAQIRTLYADFPAWINSDDLADEWLTECEVCVCMLSGYAWRWADDPQIAEVVCSEQQFLQEIVNPETGRTSRLWRKAGKIDKIVRLADGRLALMEHKTCSEDISVDSDWWKQLLIDQQISLYVIAARQAGYQIDTVLYDVLRKPGLSRSHVPILDADGKKIVVDVRGTRVYNTNATPRQAADKAHGWTLQTGLETVEDYANRVMTDIGSRPDYYYARREVPRLDGDLLMFASELWQQAKLLTQCRKSGFWYRNTSACRRMGKCAYFDICTNGIDPLGELPTKFVRVTNVHPELSLEDDDGVCTTEGAGETSPCTAGASPANGAADDDGGESDDE